MGNCQAAEAATVVIQHPGGKVERAYWSLSASQVMADNPGHYVAVIIDSNPSRRSTPLSAPPHYTSVSCTYRGSSRAGGGGATAGKHLKLLRPDDTLRIGHVYRLVSFEEVLREFSSKRNVKLSRLVIKQKEKTSRPRKRNSGGGGGGASSGQRRQSRHGGGSREAEPDTSPATQQEQQVEKEEEEEEAAGVEAALEEVVQGMMALGRTSFGGGAAAARQQGQWRPALQSIAEVGS